jgi:hypothetical protein
VGFFSVLSAEDGNDDLTVKKVDVNIWILPGLFGRQVILCDVGLKVQLTQPAVPDENGNRKLRLRVGVPFRLRDEVRDLSHLFYDNKRTANLVFGNSSDEPKRALGSSYYRYDDGEGQVNFVEVDTGKSRVDACGVGKDAYTLYSVVSAQSVKPGDAYYLRLRFPVDERFGNTWSWQRIGRRKSFAIADLRVNEFRDHPVLEPKRALQRIALPIERANVFVVVSSRVKEQRKSPEPRYVRPLERFVWEPYLERRLSRKSRESFLIYYWRKGNVNGDSPLRAFLEVEKRRPTATMFALLSGAIAIFGFILVSPELNFEKSLLSNIVRDTAAGAVALFTLLGVSALFGLARLVATFLSRWPKMAAQFDRIEGRIFRTSRGS